MITRSLRTALIATACLLATVAPRAQFRAVPLDEEQGHVGLGLALRHLQSVGIFMNATAHPDDESNGLLVMLNRGQGMLRTVLATATRGNGGQNEIGPELFEALGVLRTSELEALHRFDGAEQYFTRAVDFGYSFSNEETLEKWGREEITGDFVHLMRMIRPDVILTMRPDGTGGGQHHQVSAILALDAYKLAGDPTKYPEQLKDGLRPWQPRKLYQPGSGGRGKLLSLKTDLYDPLLGKTYSEIGTEARSMHKCQGMALLLSLPTDAVDQRGGFANQPLHLVDTTLRGQQDKDEESVFDGIDTRIESLAQYAGPSAPAGLTSSLSSLAGFVRTAEQLFETKSDAATLEPIMSGLAAVRRLRADLGSMGLSADARFEIDFRLAQKEREFTDAAMLANGLRLEALADDGLVVPGQTLKVTTIVANRGTVDVGVKRVTFEGLEGDASACQPSALNRGRVMRCIPTLKVPENARITAPYWERKGEAGRYIFEPDAPFGLPFRPTPFRAHVELAIGDGSLSYDMPVEFRYPGNVFSGEKRMELLVVPRFSVEMTPDTAIMPLGAVRAATTARAGRPGERADRELRVTVTNGAPGASEGQVTLELPAGWKATPASAPVKFSLSDEAQTVRFTIVAPATAVPGHYTVRASVSGGGIASTTGYQVIEYPHIRRRHIYHSSETTMEVIDVKTAANLTIGYVMGVGDEVPAAIEQLGATVVQISPDQLAWGDLSRFDAIVTGVRAYERREDLRAHNARLLDYVKAGGTLIVQYNKFEFNDAQYGPYPAKVSSNRVTDEFAPVKVLKSDDPVFNFPNKIEEGAWKGWVQERGLYFLGEKDPRYVDLVAMADPFPNNPGEKTGALVQASYGKGRWIYVGLGLWRQLPAGTDGAYSMLANLLSLGKVPASRSTAGNATEK